MAMHPPITALVADFETSGLTMPAVSDLAKQPHAIEFAGVLLRSGEIVGEFETLIMPPILVAPEITKITGITNELLKGAPLFDKALPEIAAFVKRADAWIGHYAQFDIDVMRYELLRLGEEAERSFPWPRETICTVQEFFHEFGRRAKLTELYERKLGRPLKQEHRAMSDVRALVEIVLAEGLA